MYGTLNSLNDFNIMTIVWVHCVYNCDICQILREAKNKPKKKTEAKTGFKDKNNFCSSF